MRLRASGQSTQTCTSSMKVSVLSGQKSTGRADLPAGFSRAIYWASQVVLAVSSREELAAVSFGLIVASHTLSVVVSNTVQCLAIAVVTLPSLGQAGKPLDSGR